LSEEKIYNCINPDFIYGLTFLRILQEKYPLFNCINPDFIYGLTFLRILQEKYPLF